MAQTGPRDKATIEALKERMARDPLSRAFLQLAEEYRKAGRFEEAVQVCQEGLARHPGYHTARIALGRTYLDAGDLESAHQALTEVLDTMPENHLAAKLLAEVQLRLGNRAGAAETYRAILTHYPGDREVEGLLSELGERGDAADGPPDPVEAPVEAAGADPGAAIPAAPETASPPPPLEVVDGGEPLAAPASADEMTAAVAPADEQTTALPAEADALQTNTLAELYLRQGLVEKALEVYHAMLRVDSGNEHVRRRLEELSGERMSPPGAGSAAAAPAIPAPALAEPIDPAGRSESAAVESPAPPAPSVRDMDVRSGLSAPPVEEDKPAPAAPPETVSSRPTGTIGRLERWLAVIQSASLPAERESRQ